MTTKQISAAFVKAQKGFAPALKDTKNEFFKSKYADLSACVKAVIDSLNENGIALMQTCHECESGVTVETMFLHESGESLLCGKLHVPASKQDPQGYGSALTYARRYSLMAACGIAPEDDDGNAASQKQAQPKNFDKEIAQIRACTKLDQLSKLWNSFDAQIKHVVASTKDDQKAFIESSMKQLRDESQPETNREQA